MQRQVSSRGEGGLLELIDKLQRQGAQGIILGCTELPLLISQEDRPGLPMFDTAGLHVVAALKLATQ
jgi:aspartate racemase